MPKPIAAEHHYVPGIDGLRTIAVAAVVLFHIGAPGVAGGLLGVGVFFTLSGYLITSNLMRAWDRDHKLGLGRFWLRRFRRLMPAAVLTIIVAVILTAVFARDRLSEWGLEGLSALFYVNNWHVIFQERSYFDTFGMTSPLSHMWSLSVEEQFYLVWPPLLLLLLWLLRRRDVVMVATAILGLASFAWMAYLAEPGVDATRIYEGTDTRAGGMLLGACLALWLSSRKSQGKSIVPSRAFSTILGAIGLGVIVVLFVLIERENIFLYRGGILLLTLATVLAIFGVLHPNGLWNKVLGWEPLRWLGERSFGIYLWHMPIIAFMPQPWFEQHRLIGGLLVAAVSILLAALSWTIVEDPIRRHGVVEPFRQWRRARAATREVEGVASATTLSGSRFPGYFGSAAAVILVALLTVGAPQVIGNPAGASSAAPKQVMEIPEQSRGDNAAASDDADAAAPAPAPEAQGNPQMSCKKVVHVGDSTSIGMFSEDMVNNPEDTALKQYVNYGAKEVVDSVFGARSTTEGWNAPDDSAHYPSAIDSVRELRGQHSGPGTCWVIATGVNDAANYDAGGGFTATERIEAMMDLLDGQNVMWSTARTNTNDGYYAQKNMDTFNSALREALKKYPNLRLFDWAAEAQPEWYAPNDYAHYSTDGNSRRAYRYAAALAAAFPKALNGKPSEEKVVRSGF